MSSKHHQLCISLLPESFHDLKEWLPQSQEADLIEIRIDYLPRLNFKKVGSMSKNPLIIALRSREEGGFWQGSAEEYWKAVQAAIAAKMAYVDIEYERVKEEGFRLKKRSSSKVILSCHTDEKSLTVLKGILDDMTRIPADVYKLVFSAFSLADNLSALGLIDHAGTRGINFVIHAAGDHGQLSRLIGATRGNLWTYTSRDQDSNTARGQVDFHEAKHYYFLSQKSYRTRLLGLLGFPVQQSKGWRLHNRLIERKQAEINHSESSREDFLYVNFPVEHFDEFWIDWKNHLHGLSVTLPYKEKVLPYLNKLSTEVKISGVCNTMVKNDSEWHGYNTDLIAIETLLRPYQEKLKDGILIVGTGGTARSAIAVLKRLDISPIFVVGRNHERGKLLADLFGVDFLREDEVHYARASGIIQTTPVGMVPYTSKHPLGTSLFRNERVVLDVIYNPPETRFLSIARERGCITISGEEMFLIQAAKQFELFTGLPVSIEEIRDVWKEIN